MNKMGANSLHPSHDLSDMSSEEDFSSDYQLTTDAAVKSSFPNPDLVINLKELEEIERKLDTYEMISLVYLLYDSPLLALQELELWLNGSAKKLLHSWAVHEQSAGLQWQRKLVEALCIIQNYAILKTYGFKKLDLLSHYLPHQPHVVLFVNATKKAVYCICEKLTKVKTEKLLTQVRSDFDRLHLTYKVYDPQFMEMYFLYWETVDYVKSNDFSNLKIIFKIHPDCDAICEILDKISNTTATSNTRTNTNYSGITVREILTKKQKHFPLEQNLMQRNGSNINDCQVSRDLDHYSLGSDISDQLSSNLSSMGQDDVNTSAKFTTEDHENRYNIDPKNPGVCLIINQENFYQEFDVKYKDLLPTKLNYKLESRKGTSKDKEHLEECFKRFGFTVKVENDLTHFQLIETIKSVVADIREESSLVICILSHGDKNIVYGVNSCRVDVSYIQQLMCKTNKKNLLEKPKILILQSCQGTNCQKIEEDSEEDESVNKCTIDGGSSTPCTANMLTFWATIPGYAAIRNKKKGSWFIQSLCTKMKENGNRLHFADLCTRIVKDVTSKTWKLFDDELVMTPVIVTSLTKDFYLPCIEDE